MASADSSVVLLAFPTLTQSLNTNVSTSLWTILAYMLVTAVLTTQLGKVGDTFGRAKMFNYGFVVFTAASALCGAAPNIISLIGFRVIQGIGAAMVVANSGAIVADTFPREKLGRAYGFMSSGWGIGAILGIVLGGALTTLLGWRYIFYINVPIGIIAMILGFKYVKDSSITSRRIDLFGMLLLGVALLLISYDAVNVAAVGFSWTDAVLIALGVVMIILLLWRERHTKDALIDLSVFKSRVLAFSILAAFFVSLGYFSVFFMITLYLQGIVGLTPLNAALLLSPGAVIGFLLSPIMGRLSDRIGARIVATIGICFLAAAVLIYLTISPNPANFSWATIILASSVAGIGTAMFFPSNNSAVMKNAAQGAYGSVNGLLRTMQNVGGLTSFAVVIYIAATSVPRSIAFQVFVGTSKLIGGIDSAFVGGIQVALLYSLVLLIFAAILSFARGRRAPQARLDGRP